MSEQETPSGFPPTTPGKPMSWPEHASFSRPNGKRAVDHTLLTSFIALGVALCGMFAAILVPYISGKQQLAITMAILDAQRDQTAKQAEAAAKLIAITDETKVIAQKVDGRLTAALEAKATALELAASLQPGNVVAQTRAKAARIEAIPPVERTPVRKDEKP